MRLQHTFCGGDDRLMTESTSRSLVVIPTTSVVMPLSLTALISSCSNYGFGGNSHPSVMMMAVFGISGRSSLVSNRPTCVLISKPPTMSVSRPFKFVGLS